MCLDVPVRLADVAVPFNGFRMLVRIHIHKLADVIFSVVIPDPDSYNSEANCCVHVTEREHYLQ